MSIKTKVIAGASVVAILSAIQIAYADGFFSKLFGGSSKGGASVETLLENVPADTAYLMTNKESLPEKVVDAHIARGKAMLTAFSQNEDMKKALSSDKGPGKFFAALLEDYSSLIESGKFEETGLSKKVHSIIYGYDMMPIIRIGIKDQEKVIAMIKRAEAKAQTDIGLTKCGDSQCVESTDPKGDMAFSGVISKNDMAFSLFSVDKKAAITKHLMGEAKPASSYKLSDWEGFLKGNNYPGYGDGFIDLKKVFAFAKPKLSEQLGAQMDEKELNGCLAVAEAHIDNMPKIVFGTKKFDENAVDYELVFNTSANVSTALKTLANTNNIPQRSENPIFDFGVNIDFKKMREAATQYSNFLIDAGDKNGCSAINAQEIRKSMGGLSMVMNMGLSQFKSIYGSLTDLELDNRMQPKKLEAVVSLGSDDPAGLLSMASMMAPPLASIKVPSDGSVVKLPDGLIPSRGGSAPEIFLSQSKDALNIMVGSDKPAMQAHKASGPEISFTGVDYPRYMKIMSKVMEMAPSKGAPDLELMNKIGAASGKVFSTTSADDRGLAINYQLRY